MENTEDLRQEHRMQPYQNVDTELKQKVSQAKHTSRKV